MSHRIFVAEVTVIDQGDADRREQSCARDAEQWFGSSVVLEATEVSLREVDGVLRYVLTAKFAPQRADGPAAGRLARAARWLGLTTQAGTTAAKP